MIIFIKLVYLSSVISLKWQWRLPINCHLSEITDLKYTSFIKMVILEENVKWHLEAFASELFIYYSLVRAFERSHYIQSRIVNHFQCFTVSISESLTDGCNYRFV